MKSMILAAGMGTRLLPYTRITPKPLFPIAGQPLIDISIRALIQAGSTAVIINTHHLHRKIDSFIKNQNYDIPVHTRHEPVILGTGGGIKNAIDFFDDHPFMVVNSDIVTDINLKKVYDFHLTHKFPVTLVLYDDPTFNSVSFNERGFVTNFEKKSPNNNMLTFTGIQVINPEVLDFIPSNVFSSIIDTYNKIISNGEKIKAFISKNDHWEDIGTLVGYKKTVIDQMAPEAFKRAFSEKQVYKIKQTKLKGDGSERKWYRLTAKNRSLVMVDHGIRENTKTCEVDSFVAIGIHLYKKKIPVPKIYLYDTFSGLVFLKDLGDVNLQALVQKAENQEVIMSYYKSVIDQLVKMSGSGATGFDLSWTYQSETYDKNLIMEKECRYFVEAFLTGYLGMQSNFKDLKEEFSAIADKALESSFNGFMHRDMQSRNIMVKNGEYYFIDFQGGRMGPIEYDLASLLIDPYVNLSSPIQDQLCKYCIEKLLCFTEFNPDKFRTCLKYCVLTRNFQILGAFAHLSRKMGKTYFEQYIPEAVKTLQKNLLSLSAIKLPKLLSVVKKINI
ncbi:MAG: phosphotransferase [Deltaproteobacteria bacterium]|nr:phosphotransferase [Deltaproteobacteria bacterium]MBT8373966.1 phosphotransferase [Deltaproteobacteria bacterium]